MFGPSDSFVIVSTFVHLDLFISIDPSHGQGPEIASHVSEHEGCNRWCARYGSHLSMVGSCEEEEGETRKVDESSNA